MTTANGPFVFDSSAVLALLFNEPGASTVQSCLKAGIRSAVNVAEVLAKLSDKGTSFEGAKEMVLQLGLDLRPMDLQQAQRSAEFRLLTRTASLSLGDRACFALAAELGLPVLTADRPWSKIATAVTVAVTVIR